MIRISIAGDFVPINRMASLDEESIQTAFSDVAEINRSCDYSIVNLECPIVLSDDVRSIEKVGPKFKTDETAVKMLHAAKMSCVTLSNNHFCDYGEAGVRDTIDTLDRNGIEHLGGGRNLDEASKTLFKTIKDKRFAFINCSEREFATATQQSGGANPLDPITQYYAIQEARKNADFVIVIVHGGVEQYPYPTPTMKKTYRFLIDAGADAVVSHHQHFHCGYEVYKDKPVFYGLGNFCFDHRRKRDSFWHYGYMVTLSFDENHGTLFDVHPFVQCNHEIGVKMLTGEKKDSFFDRLARLNEVIADDKRLQETFEQYLSKTMDINRNLLSPYTSKWAISLFGRGWLPSFCSKRKKMLLFDRIECDSHRERLLHYLQYQMKH